VNCGDGDMREAADWVEYCNGKGDSHLAKMRRKNGGEAPYNVKYWVSAMKSTDPGKSVSKLLKNMPGPTPNSVKS